MSDDILKKAITQDHLTPDTVDAQFCSVCLKEQIKALFANLAERDETNRQATTALVQAEAKLDSAHALLRDIGHLGVVSGGVKLRLEQALELSGNSGQLGPDTTPSFALKAGKLYGTAFIEARALMDKDAYELFVQRMDFARQVLEESAKDPTDG